MIIPPLFPPGRLVVTPAAFVALAEAFQSPWVFLVRHCAGQHGHVSDSDLIANSRAVDEGGRIISAYRTKNGQALWVITDLGTQTTTVLLPEWC